MCKNMSFNEGQQSNSVLTINSPDEVIKKKNVARVATFI